MRSSDHKLFYKTGLFDNVSSAPLLQTCNKMSNIVKKGRDMIVTMVGLWQVGFGRQSVSVTLMNATANRI